MIKNGLFILNLGLLIVMFSAVGDEMRINCLTLIIGLFIVGLGAIITLKRKINRN